MRLVEAYLNGKENWSQEIVMEYAANVTAIITCMEGNMIWVGSSFQHIALSRKGETSKMIEEERRDKGDVEKSKEWTKTAPLIGESKKSSHEQYINSLLSVPYIWPTKRNQHNLETVRSISVFGRYHGKIGTQSVSTYIKTLTDFASQTKSSLNSTWRLPERQRMKRQVCLENVFLQWFIWNGIGTCNRKCSISLQYIVKLAVCISFMPPKMEGDNRGTFSEHFAFHWFNNCAWVFNSNWYLFYIWLITNSFWYYFCRNLCQRSLIKNALTCLPHLLSRHTINAYA